MSRAVKIQGGCSESNIPVVFFKHIEYKIELIIQSLIEVAGARIFYQGVGKKVVLG